MGVSLHEVVSHFSEGLDLRHQGRHQDRCLLALHFALEEFLGPVDLDVIGDFPSVRRCDARLAQGCRLAAPKCVGFLLAIEGGPQHP